MVCVLSSINGSYYILRCKDTKLFKRRAKSGKKLCKTGQKSLPAKTEVRSKRGKGTGKQGKRRHATGRNTLFSGKAVSFVYPSVPVAVDAASRMAPEREVMLPWTYDVHRYPDQMALICRVEGVGLSSDVLAVGAFCGDECRGTGLLQADGLLFLSVHGTLGAGEEVSTLKGLPHGTYVVRGKVIVL